MGWVFLVFHNAPIDELGDGLIYCFYLLFIWITIISPVRIFALEEASLSKNEQPQRVEYYKYWNPYRRVLDLRGKPQSFYGQTYYQVDYNKDNRVKSVTKFGKDRLPKETYNLVWSRSGARSEYTVVFQSSGNISRLDQNLYSNILSNIRPGWQAKFKSRSDGRPKEVSVFDSKGVEYFSYYFNYTIVKDDRTFSEVIESSYFDSDRKFVGRHLIYWGRGAVLRMIQYFNAENKIIETIEYINDNSLGETVRVLTDDQNREVERKIIPYMPADKYAYKYEWTGREVIDRGLQELESLDLAVEFARRAEEALNDANEELARVKDMLDQANQRARNAEKLMRKAEGKAKEVEEFKSRMEIAQKEAEEAIKDIYDAEREAERARLEAAAATATLDAVRKTKDVEVFAQDEAKRSKKEAKRLRKEARRKARDAKRAVQDSLLGTGPKSYLTLSYGQPFIIEETLKDHSAGINYTFGLGRRNMFRLDSKDIDVGLEINWFDFTKDLEDQDLQTISYFLVAQLDPRLAWSWIPSTLETAIKIGGGAVSPGYGATLGGSAVFNLLPTPIIIGATTQFNWVSGAITEDTQTYWITFGLMFGVNLQDKIPEIFDIDIPNIFDIF